MFDISGLIQSGAANPWLYLPAAVLLGALHALEPGHSKSLMAAFIVAIRGTTAQAVLLGVSAAIGHTIIVWGLALLGLYLGDRLILEKAEPWLILISGVLIILLAARLLFSIHRTADHHAHDHSHDHSHDHPHAQSHDDHQGDAHAAAHAREIEGRFAGRQQVSAGEIAWFGFTGGLLPCPAAIAVLLVCLQLKAFALGMAMVAAFSIGLAITLVTIGIIAAWGTRRAAQSWSGFDVWSRRLPYISGALVMALGLFITLRGLGELGFLKLA
jgi:nickel/cobalt transporter (NicO) family protein